MKLQKTKKVLGLIAVAALGFGSAASQAALIDRGGGLIYDDVLNVTWLQDARYAVTTGAAPFGSLSGSDAKDFADGLELRRHGARRRLGRLAPAADVRRAALEGYDVTGASSELAYMYYINLGYAPNYDPHTYDPVPSVERLQPVHQHQLPRLLDAVHEVPNTPAARLVRAHPLRHSAA